MEISTFYIFKKVRFVIGALHLFNLGIISSEIVKWKNCLEYGLYCLGTYHLKDLAYNPQRISLVFALTLAPTRLNHKKYGLCIIQEHNICIIWKSIHTSFKFWKMSLKITKIYRRNRTVLRCFGESVPFQTKTFVAAPW